MSKVFGTLAAVILAVSAFVAWKNQQAYQAEIDELHKEQNVEKSTTAELDKQQKRLADATSVRDEKNSQAETVEADLAKAEERYQAAKKKVDALKEEHDKNEAEIANANDILKGLPNPRELVPKIKRMRGQLAAAKSDIATEEARLANLTQQDKNGKNRISGLRDIFELYNKGKSFPSLKTRISSVYRNWGFVILAAGDKQGVVTGSILDVVRGGEVIGKLKVTAVEAGRASADVVLDSVAEGVTLRVGDSVVAEREEAAAQPATAAAQ